MYKKAAETQERQIFDKKQKMKDALAQGKQLPTELRNDARQMGADLRRDEAQTGECLAHTSEETRKGQLYLYSDEGFRVSVGACNTRSTSKERETRAHCRVFFSRPTDSIHLVARFCSYADMLSLLFQILRTMSTTSILAPASTTPRFSSRRRATRRRSSSSSPRSFGLSSRTPTG